MTIVIFNEDVDGLAITECFENVGKVEIHGFIDGQKF